MKRVLRPPEPEEAIFYSDFSGKLLKDFVPVVLKIECGYGSKYDGAQVELHLADEDLESVLKFLKQNICEGTKKTFINTIDDNIDEADKCIECRDWQSSDFHYNNVDLYRKLL